MLGVGTLHQSSIQKNTWNLEVVLLRNSRTLLRRNETIKGWEIYWRCNIFFHHCVGFSSTSYTSEVSWTLNLILVTWILPGLHSRNFLISMSLGSKTTCRSCTLSTTLCHQKDRMTKASIQKQFSAQFLGGFHWNCRNNNIMWSIIDDNFIHSFFQTMPGDIGIFGIFRFLVHSKKSKKAKKKASRVVRSPMSRLFCVF